MPSSDPATEPDAAQGQSPRPQVAQQPTRSSIDEMSEASFPASDAPAVWTWDVPAHSKATDTAGAAGSGGEQVVQA